MAWGSQKIPYFTDEQQKIFEGLTMGQQKYVKLRARGYNKRNAYVLAWYKPTNATQAAYLMEKKNEGLQELINALRARVKPELNKTKEELEDELEGKISAKQKERDEVQKAIEVVESSDSETAERIKFYRDIINGKIKSTKKVTRKNDMGKIIEVRIEENSDVDAKMRARRELDKILGLSQVIDVGELSMGDITVNIVDASKKDALVEAEVVETVAEGVEGDGEQ